MFRLYIYTILNKILSIIICIIFETISFQIETALDFALHQCLKTVKKAALLRTELERLHENCVSDHLQNSDEMPLQCEIYLGIVSDLDNMKLLQVIS